MIRDCAHERLDPNWVEKFPKGTVRIEENFGQRSAGISFDIDVDALVLRHRDNQPPLKWCLKKKCADAAIILQKDDVLELHIIELKSKLTLAEWKRAREQFEGMALNAFAMIGALEGRSPDRLICHISFSVDAITRSTITDPVLLKFPVGSLKGLGGLEDWEDQLLDILGRKGVELRKWLRDPHTNEGAGSL